MEKLTLMNYVHIMQEHVEERSMNLEIPINIDVNALIMIARGTEDGKRGTQWVIDRVDQIINKLIQQNPSATQLIYEYRLYRAQSL